jgi:hypothetical protein
MNGTRFSSAANWVGNRSEALCEGVPPLYSNRPLKSTLCIVALLMLAGCVAVGGGSLSEAPEEVGEGQVGMELFSDPTGSTLLMVPVYFGDSGPFQFVLDTGASRTVLAPDLADELGLDRGQSAQGQGIESEFNAETIEVEGWRVGDVELQPRTLITAQLPEVPAQQGPQFRGLLGSDVLAGFGVVEIDYDEQILTLRSGD